MEKSHMPKLEDPKITEINDDRDKYGKGMEERLSKQNSQITEIELN